LAYLLAAPAILPAPAPAQPAFEEPQALSPPGTSVHPDVVVDGAGTVHVVWSQRLGGGEVAPYTALLYARSFDQGRTYTAPVQALTGSLYTTAFDPRLAAAGGFVYVVARHGGKGDPGEIRFARSPDGGASFGQAIHLSLTLGTSTHPRVAASPGGAVFVAWVEQDAPFGPAVRLARSLDRGATFEPARTIFSPPLPGSFAIVPVSNLELALDPASGALYVLWDEVTPGDTRRVMLSRSLDGGDSFAPPLVLASGDVRHATLTARAPGRIHASWQQAGVSPRLSDIVATESTDDGDTFGAPTLLSDPIGSDQRAAGRPWAASGPNGTLAVGWEVTEASPPDVVVKLDTGGGPSSPATSVSSTAGPSIRGRGALGPDGTLYVVWQEGDSDGLTGSAGVFLRRAPPPRPPAFSLTVDRSGAGSGRVTSAPPGIDCGTACAASFDAGTGVALTASPGPGSVFTGWSGDADCSDGSVSMTGDRACLATFAIAPPGTGTLTILKAGPGSGRVSSVPAGIDCGPDCSEPFQQGMTVTLTATATLGSTFVGWSDPACGPSETCRRPITGDATLTATFTVATELRPARTRLDFDGDGLADLGVFRPATGEWFVFGSSRGFAGPMRFGAPGLGDQPVPADYDGDGRTDLAVYRRSTGAWFVFGSDTGFAGPVAFGASGLDDVPVPADYDGDGRADVAVFRRSTGEWFILGSATGFGGPVPFGAPGSGDRPVPADYDGDGRADLAVFRQATGEWFVFGSSASFRGAVPFGAPGLGDQPVSADYDGDGRSDLAVFRHATGEWFVFGSGTGFPGAVPFGAPGLGDVPVPADYDGDGKADLTVFRRPTAEWFVFGSATGFAGAIVLGSPAFGDAPVE
jgi:hypothetical protein